MFITNNKFHTHIKTSVSMLALVGGLNLGIIPFSANAARGEEKGEEFEEVVVTGSRIRRDQFSSAAPLQTYDIGTARQLGISTIGELLQRSTISNGQQLNGTLNTNAGNSNASEAPPTGGVGSANIGLRALGPERTLLMVNGRRMGSSGVRGAPAQPDLNLLPLNMVERIEVITEGASSVYGADAVAGVVNVILRDSFEGIEFTGNFEAPGAGGGEVKQFSFITGINTDKSKFVISGEYYDRKRLRTGARAKCISSIYTDNETGKILDFCQNGFFDNAGYDAYGNNPIDAFTYYTPGTTNIGILNWSSAEALAGPTDPRLTDGTAGVFDNRFTLLPEYSDENERMNADLVSPQKRFSIVSVGSYSPDFWGGNEEFYYEAFFMHRSSTNIGATEQIFPGIPGMIPQEDANGNIVVSPDGSPVLVDNPMNPFPTGFAPIVTLDDLAQVRKVELNHIRFVGGFRGDFAGSNWFADNDWNYDANFSYDRGVGFQSQPVLNEVNLGLSLDTLRLDVNGNPICGLNTTFDIGFRTPQKCVVVDFFAPSIYESLANGDATDGTFATDKERNWLIADRLNRTVVEQTMAAAYLSGNLFAIPGGGDVGVAIGAEYRKDAIDSSVEFLGANANNAAENALSEGATVGSREIYDIFAEINIPIVSGKEGIEYLGVEGAFRYTDESNFGSKVTDRARIIYRPNDWIQVSGSYGTSFRAPNLRETYLAAQGGGVSGRLDPCSIPRAARPGGVYNAALDTRSQTVLDNCVLSGADPTQLGLQASVTVPTTVGGNAIDLLPETSRTFTATLQLTPHLSDDFDFDVAISYFDINVKNTIRQPSVSDILSRCYNDTANLASPFCERISRDSSGTADPFFNFVANVDASFVNIGQETSKGFDINTRFRTSFDDVLGAPLEFVWTNAVTFQTERIELIFADDPLGPDELKGDFGIPARRYTSTLSLARGRWELLLETRHLSGTEAKREIITNTSSCLVDADLAALTSSSVSSVCTAAGAWYQDMALTYRGESFLVTAGVNNLFDKQPPRVDRGAGSNRANRLTSSGYDQFGRSFFLNVTKRF